MRALTVVTIAVSIAGAAQTQFLPGVIDTVGGTTFDNQNSAPSQQWIAVDPATGIHVIWMFSAQGSSWPDRRIRYNFHDTQTGQWTWLEPDFMSSGMECQTRRTGYGSLEIDPETRVALVAAHYAPAMMQFAPVVVRDGAPGGGVFEECVGSPTLEGYFLPVVTKTPNGTTQLLLIRFQTSDNLYFSYTTTWCDWGEAAGWNQTGAYGHNMVASHTSNKVFVTWMTGNNRDIVLSYRFSTDGGASWDAIQQLVPPDAFGGDTGTVCYVGANALFDRNDDWQLVTTLVPLIDDSAYLNPAELWLYSSGTSAWTKIHRAEAATLAGSFGSNATICGRPSLGQNPESDRLYVTWEQFDSLNVESSTSILRADIWVSWSDDGVNWAVPARLTEPDNTTKRFPCLARNCPGDSLAVLFEQDIIAGFNSDGVGDISNNPICVWRGSAVGIAEAVHKPVDRLSVTPNPGPSFRFTLGVETGTVDVFSADGRLARSLAVANGTAFWDGADASGAPVQPGCYMARARSQGRTRDIKLVLVR